MPHCSCFKKRYFLLLFKSPLKFSTPLARHSCKQKKANWFSNSIMLSESSSNIFRSLQSLLEAKDLIIACRPIRHRLFTKFCALIGDLDVSDVLLLLLDLTEVSCRICSIFEIRSGHCKGNSNLASFPSMTDICRAILSSGSCKYCRNCDLSRSLSSSLIELGAVLRQNLSIAFLRQTHAMHRIFVSRE